MPETASPMPTMPGAPTSAPFSSTLMGGLMPQASPIQQSDQRAGVLQMLRSIETQFTEAKNSLQTIAGQFPASSEDVRMAIQAAEAARSKLIGLLTTILSQTTEPGPITPRIAG